ncbi:hypothetical protein ZIOFF_066204 [Zingiber officinale]|uniref:Aminopeptidase n=1 Tax=Zingiber officinale TaxID=94328 RepID=A0A8J5K7J2_ZINOF|nr:hypothetical protein ZIOFF_066204 [Zingiber officinale]
MHEREMMETEQLQQNVEQFKGQARLPKFAIPHNYNLSINVDLSNFTFLGVIEITIDIVSPTKYLVLNVVDLVVEQSSIWFSGDLLGGRGEELKHPSSIVEVKDDEILILGFDGILPIGKGILSIKYSGIINDESRGFYRSTYEQYGETQIMALTQFEPTYARRCFPCWDEPAFKATFTIKLEVPSKLVALSNMPVISENDNGIIKTVYFQESPIMSTYLVAFVVGSLDYIETYSSDGLKIRVYTRIGKSNQGKFALDLTTKTLDFLKGYFSIPYGLPKLDLAAVPNFQEQGMENYGLLIFSEDYLFYDELSSSVKVKQQVAEIVAHELAHQWFGNRVTMEWWTDLWLNEGFADWMSYLVIDDVFPEWEKWSQLLDDTTATLELDALSDSHPIEVLNITSGIEALEMFDSITYQKGALVIRMLQSYIGDESLQKSIAAYIKRYSYLNAKTEDLWNVIQEEINEPIGDMMSTWTKQEGYPVINVMLTGNVLEINQIGLTIVDLIADAKPELSNDVKLLFINLLQSHADKLGWDARKNESQSDTLLRKQIQNTFVLLGHEKTINYAIEHLQPFTSNTSTIALSPDIKKVVYLSIMQTVTTTNRSGYEFLLKLYREADDASEKTLILSCFTRCLDPNILLESLNFLLSSEVQPLDALKSGLYNVKQAGRDIAWRWLKENWDDKIQKKWSEVFLPYVVSYIVKLFGTSEKETEILDFFASRSNPAISKALRQSFNEVMVKERWAQSVKNESTLGDTLKAIVGKGF